MIFMKIRQLVTTDARRKIQLKYGTILLSSGNLTVNTFLGSLLGFLFWVVCARVLSATELGIGAAYISAMGLIAQMGSLGLGATFIRFLGRMKAERYEFINASIMLVTVGTTILFILFAIYVYVRSTPFESASVLISLCLLFMATVSFSISQVTDRIFIAYEQTHYLLIRQQLAFVVKFAGIGVFVVPFGLTGLLLSLAVAELTALMVSIFVLIPRVIPNFRISLAFAWQLLWVHLKYTLGNHISQLLWNAPQFLLPILVLEFWGAETNAQFYINWMIATVFLIIPVSVSTAAFARASKQDDSAQTDLYSIALTTIGVLIPVILPIWLLSETLLGIFGRNFTSTENLMLLPLLLSVFPYTINTFVITQDRIRQNIRSMLVLSIAITLISIFSTLFLGQFYGLLGIGLGWFMGQFIGTIVCGIYKSSNSIFAKLPSFPFARIPRGLT